MRTASTALITMAALGVSANADVTIGSWTFDDTAFVDSVGDVLGRWTLNDGATSIPDGIVGPETDGRIWSTRPGDFVELLFEDNVVYNGAGDDLAVFETGVLDLIAIEINGVTVVRDSVFTGDVTPTQGFDVNVATFDLSEFGLGAGDTITTMRILGGFERGGTVSAYSVVGAINIPAPSPMMVLAPFGVRRRRPAVTRSREQRGSCRVR